MIAALALAALPSIVPWPRSLSAGNEVHTWPQSARVTAHIYRHRDPALGDEGYSLSIGPDGATAWANTHAGLFYAMQTLGQVNVRAGAPFRALQIRDWPRYRWRGVHLDTARHFFDVRTVERYIDVAAHYSFNVFHWHLTDDQAWRFPVPGYPLLTARGYAYSESQIREVVRYAAQRYVTVVPEVEMPAHASAAIDAYPQFGCGRSSVLCGSSATFGFLNGALDQTFRLFPGPAVHIGGDEVPPWYDEPAFVSRIERYVRSHGRRIAGWNEILSPQLSTNAIVEAWNSMRHAGDAVRRGNDAVVSGWPLYFDAAQGDAAQEPRATPHTSTLKAVYLWDIMPPGLTAREQSRVLGGEAALWTERIGTPGHLFYMLLPRELALAEMLWTSRTRKSWSGFLARLPAQFAWLDAHGYAFRIPNTAIEVAGGPVLFTRVPGFVQNANAWTSSARVRVTLATPIGGLMRYTLDGSAPAQNSRAFVAPLNLNVSTGAIVTVRAVTFFHGRRGATTECRIHRVGDAALPRTGARSFSALVSP